MLQVMEVLRRNVGLNVFVKPFGMVVRIIDRPSYTRVSVWEFDAYPKNFVDAAKDIHKNNVQSFSLEARGREYVGWFSVIEDEELVSLHFHPKYQPDEEVQIILRKTEVLKMAVIFEEYWTC